MSKGISELLFPNKVEPTEKKEIYYDKQDLMQMLHISIRTLHNWRKNGTLPFSKVNGKIYYKSSDLERLLNTPAIPKRIIKML